RGFFFFDFIPVLLEREDAAAQAGEGVGDASAVVGVGFSGGGDGEFVHEFADLDRCGVEAAGDEFGAVVEADFEVAVGFGVDAFAPGLVAEVILVSAVEPVGQVIDADWIGQRWVGGFLEFGDDLGVGGAFVEHGIYFVAQVFWETGDVTFAAGMLVSGVHRSDFFS
ncbi:MAG: hypothetical protein JWO95_521, partial [Verrucomicrobiales bacterium]|nr:hypothetical protein [Verrucomicrobiales bacterium]